MISLELASQRPEMPWNVLEDEPLGFGAADEYSETGRYRSLSISGTPLRPSFTREESVSRMSIQRGELGRESLYGESRHVLARGVHSIMTLCFIPR